MRFNFNIALLQQVPLVDQEILYPSGAPEFTPGFCVARGRQLLVICVVSCKSSLNHGINIQLVGSFPFLIKFYFIRQDS